VDEFEWDETKSAAAKEARGFDFNFAVRVFDGDVFEIDDLRFDYGERRIRATGKVEGRLLTVVYTVRGNTRRIISARIASKRERDAYRQIYG